LERTPGRRTLKIKRIGWINVSCGPVWLESVVAIETAVVQVIDQLRVVVGRPSDALTGLVDMNDVVLDFFDRLHRNEDLVLPHAKKPARRHAEKANLLFLIINEKIVDLPDVFAGGVDDLARADVLRAVAGREL